MLTMLLRDSLMPLGMGTRSSFEHGDTLTTYIDGAPKGSSAFTRTDAGTSTLDLRIGLRGSTAWNGYIQDFRIYKGIAKYTSSFSPPERCQRNSQALSQRHICGV